MIADRYLPRNRPVEQSLRGESRTAGTHVDAYRRLLPVLGRPDHRP